MEALIVREGTIIHIYHQPLQYLQAQTKLKESRHYRWMGFSTTISFGNQVQEGYK
jgi:hypothetical protein